MESIQQGNIAATSTTCCTSPGTRSQKMTNSTTKGLALLIVAAIISFMNRYRSFSSVYSTEKCTSPCINPTSPISLVAVLGAGHAPGVRHDESATSSHGNISFPLQPIIVELGAIALFHMLGFPMIGRVGVLARRVKIMRLGRTLHLPAPFLRQLSRQTRFLTRTSAKIWKTAEAIYSKTSLSKLVQRIKKLLKIFSHAHDDEEEETRSRNGAHSQGQ